MGCDETKVKDEKYVKNYADQIDVKIHYPSFFVVHNVFEL